MTRIDDLPSLKIDGNVATIEINRPAVANRIGPDDLEQMHRHLERVNGTDVFVLRIRASGKYFCSGFDVTKLAGRQKNSGFEDLVNALEDCRPVTIAALNGGVYGGATDLALACDFRIGVTGMDMFMPAARLGLRFYRRGMERFVSRLGIDTAKLLFLTAGRLEACAMERCGFLSELVDPDQLQVRVDALTSTIASLAPLALLRMKQHLNAIARNELDVSVLASDIERAIRSSDIREGALTWKEKRKPVFTGQ